jgi:outer membrane usher protein FimD/PapC
MFIRICATGSIGALWAPHFQNTVRRGFAFYFILALLLASPFSIVTTLQADEIITAAASAHPAAASAAISDSATAPHRSLDATIPLVVRISVNTEAKGDFFVELDNEGQLFIRMEDVIDILKLSFAEDRTVLIRNERFVPLDVIRDVRHSFDEKNLAIAIMGKTWEARKTAIEIYPLPSKPKDVYYPRENSAFFNYGATYSYANPLGFQSFVTSGKLGVRSGDLFFISDSIYTKTEKTDQFVRLLSNATYERRDDLQWLVLGDQFATSGDMGSSINIGGIGFSKVYKLDPYFITQPLFSVGGVTAFPSQAEIYMDGVLVGKQSVAPGAFELKNIYGHGGARNIEVVLKDPFGQEQRISYPMYFSTLLLRKGLHEYSYNAGFIREQYGVESNKYGKPAFSAFHRYGVTNSLNIGTRAEVSDGIYNAGISSSFLIPRAGSFAVSLAGSAANGDAGTAVSFQHSYQIGSFSTNLLLRGFSREYATVGNPSASNATKYEMSLGVGFLLNPLGSISLSYSDRDVYRESNTRVASVSFSRELSKIASFFMTASATRQQDTDYSLFAGVNFNFDKGIRGAAQYSKTGSTDTETMQLQNDVPVGEGLAYRVSASRSETKTVFTNSFNPYLQHNTRYGTYSLDAGIRNSTDGTYESYNLSAAGSLVYADGFYGLSRPVRDSFGIVMVGKLPNAKVLNNGQEIGETDCSGMMIVPSLASYSHNQITLDAKNIPMDYSISDVNMKISPSLWSGSCIAFDVRKSQAVAGSLHVKEGNNKAPVEYAEISMKVGDSELKIPTGKGGEFYIENIFSDDSVKKTNDYLCCHEIAKRRKSDSNFIQPGSYPAWADFEGKRCEFSIIFPATEDAITDLGEIQCVIPCQAISGRQW